VNEPRERRGRIGGQPPGLRWKKSPPEAEEDPAPPRERAAKKKTAKKKTAKKKAAKKKAAKKKGTKRRGR